MSHKVKLWLIKAFEDYMGLKFLSELENIDYLRSVICFHAQQMVEKLLKAFLTFHNIPFPRTHILEILKQKCIELDEDFQNLDFKKLSKYAVEIRYPEEFKIPSIEETKECIRIALQVKDFILGKLNVTEDEILSWMKELKEEQSK
jgi:HEPN domain-containing protein